MIPRVPLTESLVRRNRAIAEYCSYVADNPIRCWEYAWAEEIAGLDDYESARIVDLGGGNGGFSQYLGTKGHQLLVVDPYCTLPRNHLREMPSAGSVLYKAVPASQMPDLQCDSIISISALEHFTQEEYEHVLDNVARWVVPGGTFVVTLDLYLDLPLGAQCELGTNRDCADMEDRLSEDFDVIVRREPSDPDMWRMRSDIRLNVFGGVPLTVQATAMRRKRPQTIFALMPLLNNPDTLPDWWEKQAHYYDHIVIVNNSTDETTEILDGLAQGRQKVDIVRVDVSPANDPIRQVGLDVISQYASEGDWICLAHADEHFLTNPRAYLYTLPDPINMIEALGIVGVTPKEEQGAVDISLPPSYWQRWGLVEHYEARFVRWNPQIHWHHRDVGIGFVGIEEPLWWCGAPPFVHYKLSTLREMQYMILMGQDESKRARGSRWGSLFQPIIDSDSLWIAMDDKIAHHARFAPELFRLPDVRHLHLPNCQRRIQGQPWISDNYGGRYQ